MSENLPPAPQPTPVAIAPQTFSHEYVKELREENKGWRLKATEYEQAAKAAHDAAKAAATEAEAKITQATQSAQERVIRAEIKAEAVKAGMIDLDGLKMLDLSSVKLNAAGEIEGAAELLASAKTAKPYLFGDAKTASTQPAPKPAPSTPKKVSDMSDAEKNAARERIRRGLSPL